MSGSCQDFPRRRDKVSFEIVGRVAVNGDVNVSRSRSFVTGDVDVLVERHDLPQIVCVAESVGYHAKKMIGGFMLIRPGQDVVEAVRLMFLGEEPRSTPSVAKSPNRPG